MEGLGLEEGDGGEGSLWPIMHSIMQNLLSKDVLYPSLKEITEKVRRALTGFSHPTPSDSSNPPIPLPCHPIQLLQQGREGGCPVARHHPPPPERQEDQQVGHL